MSFFVLRSDGALLARPLFEGKKPKKKAQPPHHATTGSPFLTSLSTSSTTEPFEPPDFESELGSHRKRARQSDEYESRGGPMGTSAKRIEVGTPWRWTTEACTAAKACLKTSSEKAPVGGS
jgi:hypothetical protein